MKNILFLTTFCLFLVASISLGQGAPWTTKASMQFPRMTLSTSVVDGTIYAIGGTQAADQPAYAIVEAYDPETDVWTTRAVMPTPRGGLSTSVVDGIIYAIGGGSDLSSSLSTVEAYDPATNTWSTRRNMPTPRMALSTRVVDGIIYAIGGCTINQYGMALSIVEAYDPATNTWTTKSDMPGPRDGFSTCVVDGIIYAIGGGFNHPPASKVIAYDPKTDTWTEKKDMPTPRAGLSTCVVDGIIYAIGGRIIEFGFLSAVEAYDPATNSWVKKADMPTGRSWLSSSTVNRKIYAIGGLNGGVSVATVEEYDPSSDTKTNVNEAPNQLLRTCSLMQNYPNPFNPVTNIKYQLHKDTQVCIKIFNSLLQEVETLIDEEKNAGHYTISWDASNNASGIYFVSFKAGEYYNIRKMLLIR